MFCVSHLYNIKENDQFLHAIAKMQLESLQEPLVNKTTTRQTGSAFTGIICWLGGTTTDDGTMPGMSTWAITGGKVTADVGAGCTLGAVASAELGIMPLCFKLSKSLLRSGGI